MTDESRNNSPETIAMPAPTAWPMVLAAAIVVPFGQPSIAWFSSIAFLAIVILCSWSVR